MLEELITVNRLAALLGVTPRHVRRLISEQRLPVLRVGRRRIRLPLGESLRRLGWPGRTVVNSGAGR